MIIGIEITFKQIIKSKELKINKYLTMFFLNVYSLNFNENSGNSAFIK